MAWTAPMTATANTAFTAAQFNTHIRDNLLETAPAKATEAGGYFVSTGANEIAERYPRTHYLSAYETTSSTSFVDLETVGPTVSVTTGECAFVSMNAAIQHNMNNHSAVMAIEVSGATSRAPTDSDALRADIGNAGNGERVSMSYLITGLNPGPNTFKMTYKTAIAGVATFYRRRLTVLPF